MTAEPTAREAVLGAVRASLAAARAAETTPEASAPEAGGEPAAADGPGDRTERIETFRDVLSRVGGRVLRALDEEHAGVLLAQLAGRLGARSVALSDAPRVARLAERLGPEVTTFRGWDDRARLLAADLGVSEAQGGIAETGTLVLDSADERHRLVSLVPPVHLALLPASRLRGTLGEALGAACSAHPELAGRALTLITGPSRTADIELTLVVGVHGPEQLYVIVLEDA